MKLFNSNEISNNFSDGVDLFICSSGFENRCLNIIKNLEMSNVANTLIYNIDDFYKENIKNAKQMQSLSKNSVNIINIKYKEPEVTFKTIRETVQKYFINKPIRNVLVDITTFTHEHLLMLYRIINEYKTKEMCVSYCYTTAKKYSLENDDNMWLTKGSGDIRSVIGYPGYSDLLKGNHLIVILGFEIERIKKIIDNYDCEKITFLVGSCDESISNTHYCVNNKICKEMIENNCNINFIEISLVDAHKTKKQIATYIESLSKYNITIIPMNNKISTIGAAMLALEKRDIRLCYIPADEYNKDNYSQESSRIICFSDNIKD